MADLDAVEARLRELLEPYRAELEDATIYGMPALRWPGAGAHEYFAALRRNARAVGLYVVGIDTWPQVLEGSSEDFLRHRTGKATLSFRDLDEGTSAELEAFLARLYGEYRRHHGGR